MAIEVGQGYVTIIPSMQGIQKKISAELKPALEKAGKEAGKSMEEGISKGAESGSKSAGKTIESEVPKAAKKAGDDAGKKMGDGLKTSATKASDEVARSVQTKITSAFSKVSETFKGIGSTIKGAYGSAFADIGTKMGGIGSAIKSSAIGSVFGNLVSGAKTAGSTVLGTFKGIGGAIGSAFSSASGKASSVFSNIRAAASTVTDAIKERFGGVASAIGGALSKAGGVASSAFAGIKNVLGTVMKAGAAGIAAIGTAAVALGKESLAAYGNFEQLQGGVKLALGDDVWKSVEDRSKQAFSNMQISQNDYLDKVNFMATGLREALGGKGHEQEAADLADRVIKTQADVVSAMGITQEAADNAFQGIMKGNFTMLDNLQLGIKPTKEGMQEVIDKMNEWNATQSDRTATDYQIDNLADCQSALADYVEYMGLSGYAANEGAGTIEGSISKMKAAWTDWTAELAKPDADMGRVTENLSTSIQDVATNVIPALGRAIGSAVQQMPSLITTVGPQLGQALLSIVDEATGGMGTAVMEKLEPVTSALSGAFEGAMGWFSENQSMFEEIGGKLGDIGGKIAEALGGAIETVTPIIGDLASGALPILSAALDFLSGAFDGICAAVDGFIQLVTPVAEALSPVADAIGGAICDALKGLGDELSKADFQPFVDTITGAFNTVKGVVEDVINGVVGFFEGVAGFIADPIGTIESGLDGLRSAFGVTADNVGSNMGDVQTSVGKSMAGASSSIKGYNGVGIKSKSASATVNGNVITGSASSKVSSTQSTINKFSGKSVNVNVGGNVMTGAASSAISGTISWIGKLTGKTVDVVTNNITRNRTEKSAKGHVFKMAKHASGAIVTRPLLTSVGLVGEAGVEAVVGNDQYTGVFPLTNRRYTGPFASEISDQVLLGMRGAASSATYNVTVNATGDGDDIARAITRELRAFELTHGRR